MKILHAADLHVDSPLGGLTAYEGAPVDEIRGATRRATENLVQAAIDHDVRLVLVAGDIFDGDWRDYSTGLFWNEQLGRLRDAEIPVVSVAGNHDAASEISRNLHLPPNVTQLSESRPETKVFDDLEIAVVGQGYAQRAVTADLAQGFPESDSGLFTIGLLHTSLDGRVGHSSYAPCSVEVLRSKGYDYWALGHVHRREEVHTDPWIVFPGNLQGRKSIETGAKGASILTVASGEIVEVQHLELDDVRWHRCEVDAGDLASADDIRSAIADRFSSITSEPGRRLAAIRVVVSGASPAHDELWKDPHGFEADVRSLAIQTGRSWVEKVKVETSRPLDLAKAREDDVIGVLAQRIDDLRSDAEMLAVYEPLFVDIRKKIGADARTGDDAPISTGQIGTAEHLAECLDASLEMVVALLAEERA
ncbi:MAG: DNA repair exonuclease [bacterium]|nr:DNA repair exonuclease [bacterium]MCP4085047.1 DNA repair exonuclease [Actinomycetes bacterium]